MARQGSLVRKTGKVVAGFSMHAIGLSMTCSEIHDLLESKANPANVAGMARYGISTVETLGVNIPTLGKH